MKVLLIRVEQTAGKTVAQMQEQRQKQQMILDHIFKSAGVKRDEGDER